jgi:hypothetical protein
MLVADTSINTKVPWFSYTSAQPDLALILFRQHRRIVTYRLMEEVCFHANMANVAGYAFAARLCEAEASGVTTPWRSIFRPTIHWGQWSFFRDKSGKAETVGCQERSAARVVFRANKTKRINTAFRWKWTTSSHFIIIRHSFLHPLRNF